MNTNSNLRPKQRKSKKLMLGGLALSCLLAMGNANAVFGVGDTVIEVGPSWLQHTLNQVNTYMAQIEAAGEYTEQAMRWRNTLAHYQQQLIKMQAMISNFGLPGAQALTKVGDDYLVAERCPGQGGGGVMAMIAKPFTLDPEGNLIEQQRQICVNIRTMQNRKYNDTVDYLVKTAPEMQSFLGKLDGLRLSSSEQGAMEHSDNEALRLNNKLTAQGQEWATRMQAYDAYIATMEDNQKVLTQNAMKGKKNIIGSLVKTAVLKTALSID